MVDTNKLQGHVINDRYRVLELIGKGGSGQVYRAQDVDTGAAIALKILKGVTAEEPESVIRFEKEVAVSARLTNPHAVKVYEFGKTREGYLVIAMEFLEGKSLTQVVKSESPMPVRKAVGIIRQTLEVLSEAHRAGIVHRDLKPDNIFVLRDVSSPSVDFVKVLDFGIAKFLLDDVGGDTLSRDGFFFGTPLYISPEQALGWQVNAASDVYSLGVVFFEMLAGFPPFTAETPIGLGMKHIYEPPPLDRLIDENGSAVGVKHLLSLMLEKRPERRPANAGTALALFNALTGLTDEPFKVRVDGAALPPTEVAPTVKARPTTDPGVDASEFLEPGAIAKETPKPEPPRATPDSHSHERRDQMGGKSRKRKKKKGQAAAAQSGMPAVAGQHPPEEEISEELPVEPGSGVRGQGSGVGAQGSGVEEEPISEERPSQPDEQPEAAPDEIASAPEQIENRKSEIEQVLRAAASQQDSTAEMVRPPFVERRGVPPMVSAPEPVGGSARGEIDPSTRGESSSLGAGNRQSKIENRDSFFLFDDASTAAARPEPEMEPDSDEYDFLPRKRKKSSEEGIGIAAWLVLLLGLLIAAFLIYAVFVRSAKAAENPIYVETIIPIHDTYATHDDKTIHGFDPIVKVGIEPQQCVEGGWNTCPDKEPPQVCCPPGVEGYGYCALPDQCAATPAKWEAFRKYRGYVRFDLSKMPKGKVLNANLRLSEIAKVQGIGDPNFNIQIYALKSIGLGDQQTCEWYEQSLNDTNGTTWNTLPQNVSITPDGAWNWDVTKAVADWLTGNTDIPGNPIMPNCGFHLQDADYGKTDAPIQRWVDFSSKEGLYAPQLKVTIAQDLDGDGYFADCDEENPDIHPDAVEVCDDVDNDCDGLTDEENCDGLDNDCDGFIDEGDNLCDDGMTCLCGTCVVTCKNDCGSPNSLKCEMGEDGLWERWGCKKDADFDPCYDWYMAEKCKPGEYCQYGWCSSNCVNICDVEGDTGCDKDSTGKWYLAKCKDYDADGCLEWGEHQYCGDGSVCHNIECGPTTVEQCETLASGGCVDECLTGEKSCKVMADGSNHVVECLPDPMTACLMFQSVQACTEPGKTLCKRKAFDSAKCTSDAECFADCNESILGAKICYRDSAGHWVVGKCGDLDKDGCLEYDPVQQCEIGGGCLDGECTPGCSAVCEEPGATQCVDGDATAAELCCMDLAGDGLLEWNVAQLCDLGNCVDGKCSDEAPPCQDECAPLGAEKCVEEGGAKLLECVWNLDQDPCLEWKVLEDCESGFCDEDGSACGVGTDPVDDLPAPEPSPEPSPEPEPDLGGPWPPAEVVEQAPGEIAQPPVDATENDAAEISAYVEPLDMNDEGSAPAPEDTDNGCGCRIGRPTHSPLNPSVALLLALSSLALLALRRRHE